MVTVTELTLPYQIITLIDDAGKHFQNFISRSFTRIHFDPLEIWYVNSTTLSPQIWVWLVCVCALFRYWILLLVLQIPVYNVYIKLPLYLYSPPWKVFALKLVVWISDSTWYLDTLEFYQARWTFIYRYRAVSFWSCKWLSMTCLDWITPPLYIWSVMEHSFKQRTFCDFSRSKMVTLVSKTCCLFALVLG